MGRSDFRLLFIVRALRYRNYRLFFGGQGISLMGTWMQQVAVIWLVYRMTNSTLLLGVVAFASQIPAFILTPFAGVIADRWDRYRILLTTQVLATAQAFILMILFMSGAIAVWQVIALSIFLGLVSAFEIPARHAFVFELVENKKDLGNAIALNSSIFNVARLVGPCIAGIVIASSNEGICFLLNGISYFAVIISLVLMKIAKRKKEVKKFHIVKGLKEGVNYAFGLAPIRYILLLVGFISLVGMPYVILMPVFATEVLHGGPKTLGFLMAASGAGALLGAVYLASRKTVVGLGKRMAFAASAFGLGLALFSLSNVFWLSLLSMIFAGVGMMVQMAGSNTVLQTIVEDDMRGRIMSLYTMAFIGTVPFGSLIIGALAGKIGAPNTLLISGLSCILGAALFALKLPEIRMAIRPIYKRKGIIPIEAADIQSPAELIIPPEDYASASDKPMDPRLRSI